MWAAGRAAGRAANSKPVLATNIETGETVLYLSQKQAAREIGGVDLKTIKSYLKSGKPLKGR